MRNVPFGGFKKEGGEKRKKTICGKSWLARSGWLTASKSLLSLVFVMKRAHLVPSKQGVLQGLCLTLCCVGLWYKLSCYTTHLKCKARKEVYDLLV